MDRRHRGGGPGIGLLVAATLVWAVIGLASPAAADTSGSSVAYAGSDVRVSLSGTAATGGANEVAYHVAVINVGPDPAPMVQIRDQIGLLGALVGTIRITQGSCVEDLDAGTIVCTMGTLGAGQFVDINFTLRVFGAGLQINTVQGSTTALDRFPDNDVSATGIQLASPLGGDVRIVLGLFRRLVGRPPGEAELARWIRRYHEGSTVSFVRALTSTPAFRQDWLDRQFEAYLGRPAGPDSAYLGWLRHGRSYDDVIASVVSSTEFDHHQLGCAAGHACPLATEARDFWVRAAYQAITGAPIPHGLATSLQALLDVGTSRTLVARAIITSVAGRAKFVEDVTGHWLGRAPDPHELVDNIVAMRRSERPEQAEAAILAEPAAIADLVPGLGGG